MDATTTHPAPPVVAPHAGLRAGVWRLADPKITLASAASLLLGTALAARHGPLAWGWLGVTLAGIFCVEAAKNASGEIFDWDSGDDQAVTEADRSPFSGGKRVLVDGLMTRRQTAWVALAFYVAGILAGLAIAVWREPAVLWVGLAGVALAFFYHAPPFKLAYRGLGEVAVALTYGPLIAGGAYLVQRHTLGPDVVYLSIPLGLLIGAFLLINEFPDARADATAGKRTLVVRLGRRRAAWLFTWTILVAFVLVLLAPAFGLPVGVWLGVAGALPALAAAGRLRRHRDDTQEIIPAQGWTLLSFVVTSVAMSIGVVAGVLFA